MVRINTNNLVREITRELEDDPDISIRGLSRRLRARGVSAGNERLRALIRGARANITAATFDVDVFVTRRQAGVAAREFLGAVTDAGVTDPTHVFLSYEATADVSVTLYGQPYRRRVYTVRGRLVQPIASYTPELIAERVARQIAQNVTLDVGDGATTLIEGIDIDILNQDIRVLDSELRGSERRARQRRGQ